MRAILEAGLPQVGADPGCIPALERFAASGSIGELTRRKVVELVERVDIHEDKSVEVRFRVQDVMERAGVAFAEGGSR